jgi:hypothetical protein
MRLKGYRLWVMGQLDSNVQSPTAVRQLQLVVAERAHLQQRPQVYRQPHQAGAAQVDPFVKANFEKPGDHVAGGSRGWVKGQGHRVQGLKPGAFQALWVDWIQLGSTGPPPGSRSSRARRG